MSVQSTVPYISIKDQVVATTEGYALRFVAGEPTDVPNYRGVIKAVQAAGCIPAEEVGAQVLNKVKKGTTIEDGKEQENIDRSTLIQQAIIAITDRNEPSDFTRNGSPQTRSLEQLSGLDSIKNAERDAEWKKYQASKAE